MKTICKLFLTLLIILFSSCDGGDSSSSDYKQIIDHIDTVGAQILLTNIYNSESDPAELKGINTAGELVTPLIYNSDGSEVIHENFWIDGIYDLNEDYYLLSSNYTNGDIEDYQLISKESGVAIHFPEESGWLSNDQYTGSGERDPYWGNNPYYCHDSYSDRIVEFSINGSSISLNNYVTLDEGFRYFVMDNVANVAYIYQDIDNNYVLKIVDKDNTILYSNSEFDEDLWVTHNGMFQYSDFLDLVTLVFDEGSGTYTEERTAYGSSFDGNYVFKLSDRTLIMDSFDNVSFLHEVANPSSTPRSIDYTGLESLAAGAVQNDTLILSGYTASGSPSLIRLNPSADTVENIIPPGIIEVLSINPSPDGSLYVQGILLEDRTSCLMKIDSDGNRDILLDDLNSTIDDVVILE